MVSRFLVAVIVSVLATVFVPTHASAALFLDNAVFDPRPTSCVGNVIITPTSQVHVFNIDLSVQNLGNDDAFIWNPAAYFVQAPSGHDSLNVLRLSQWTPFAADGNDFLVIPPLATRGFLGTVSIEHWHGISTDVEPMIIGTLQWAIVSSVPNPGTASVLGLAGIVAMRRRR